MILIRSSVVQCWRWKETRQKTWREDVKEDMKCFGLSQADIEIENEWRIDIKKQPSNVVSPGKWLLRWFIVMCVV